MKTGTVLPDSFLRRIDPMDRPKGKAGVTTEEAQAKYARGQEKRLQNDCANLLRQRGIWFRQMPYGRKTPWPGFPDFLIVLPSGMVMMLECKAGSGAQSQDQCDFFDSLPAEEIYHVIYNLQQLQALLPKL